MVKELAREGDRQYREMGRYWPRERIQSVLYTDVQEICEEVFGDYLSPLHYYEVVKANIGDYFN